MLNFTLYCREMKSIWKLLAIFTGVTAMYAAVIITMYDPDSQEAIQQMVDMMPGIMEAMGITVGAASLVGFLSSFLYGFLLIAFPMAFTIISANKLIAKYVDRGSMVSLLAAPVKRRTVAFTQMKVLGTGIFVIVLIITVIQIALCEASFPGELEISKLLLMNIGLLCLLFFISGVCFFCSCLFSDTKYSVGFGAGIPSLMFVLQMLGNVGGNAGAAKYFTFFTLFNPDGLIANESGAISGILVLFAGAVTLFVAAIAVFSKKDLHI